MQTPSQIENIANNFLQKNVEFIIEDKSLKSGKLVLFSVKGFYLTFTLQINNKLVVFELPYPFDISHNTDSIIFDYSVNKLIHNNVDAQCRSMLCISKKTHKYLNNLITLKEKN